MLVVVVGSISFNEVCAAIGAFGYYPDHVPTSARADVRENLLGRTTAIDMMTWFSSISLASRVRRNGNPHLSVASEPPRMGRVPAAITLVPLCVALIAALAAGSSFASPSPGGSGRVKFVQVTSSSTDLRTNSPNPATQRWMRDHWTRAVVYWPYWDARLSWFANAWVYLDVYAIYRGSTVAKRHPQWILKDAAGNDLYIPWGCSRDACPQYAADIGNPDWRGYLIARAKALAAKGYRGIFLDDVNMDRNVGNGSGGQVAPIDSRTGRRMSDGAWKSYFDDFLEQLRRALPRAEIVHNALWFAGGAEHNASNPYVVRQIKAANYINLERGFNDSELTGGTGPWSVSALMRYIDRVHSYGAHVILQSYAADLADVEYNLAGYFLVSDGDDMLSAYAGGSPGEWWSGYETVLNCVRGARYRWNGVWRRDFTGGFVLLNEPDAPIRELPLGGTFRTTAGQLVTSVTLRASQGAVLKLP